MSDLLDKPENVYGATVTIKTRDALGQAAPWMKFLGIVGYIGIGFMAVFGVGSIVFGLLMPPIPGGKPFAPFFPLFGLVYIAFAAVLFFPVRFLMQMAKASRQYKMSSVALDLESVAVNLKKLAKFYGILMIVVLAIYLVVIVGLIIFATLFAGHLWQK